MVKGARDQPEAEDVVQIVTLLTAPAQLVLKERDLGVVEGGFRITTAAYPEDDGPLRLQIIRGDDQIVDFTTPIGITHSPRRTDRLTYSYSSRFPEEFRAIFGDGAEPPTPTAP